MDCIEIITSVERTQTFSGEKEPLVMAAAVPGAQIAEIAWAAGVDPSLMYRWTRARSIAPSLHSGP